MDSKKIKNTFGANILSDFIDNFYMISLLKNLLFTNIVYNFKNKSIIYKKFQGRFVMEKIKLGFALSAGGGTGVAHVGFLQAMEENDIRPDVITGCSMGAIAGGCYAAGVSVKTLKNTITKLGKKEVLDLNIGFFRSRALFTGKKINALLTEYIKDKNIEDLKITFGCVATDLVEGKLVKLTSGNLVEALRASSAIPMVFEPVEKDGKILVDGGVLLRTPVKLCRALGADKVVAVDSIGKLRPARSINKLMDVGTRTFSIIDDVYASKREIKSADLAIFPNTEGASPFGFDNLKKAYDAGYEEGLKYADEIKKLLK